MVIDSILKQYSRCEKYTLNESVNEYLYYVEEEPFYIPPLFSDVKTNVKMSTLAPKFVLFSAPGAAGKSSLAKYIANKYQAIYWNLANVKIGTNSFVGSILKAVGAANYSKFVSDLNVGKVLLIIDAFDEAEIISGRKMINNFILDIESNLTEHLMPTVILLARTETAQYLASFCAENSISVAHYEIGFFAEDAAKEFIVKSVAEKGEAPTIPDVECAHRYYDVVKQNILEEEQESFLGYAPVLEAIAMHIKNRANRSRMISELAKQKDCKAVIIRIMEDLLAREQEEKVVPAFKAKCMEMHSEFFEWDRIYAPEEQLVRLVNYVLFDDISYENYRLEFLPPQLVDEYQAMLEAFLPQHPFIRNSIDLNESYGRRAFTGPAFRDYTLARLILEPEHEALADMYFEEAQRNFYFPSQIFFDCYISMAGEVIQINHLSYAYESYKAKATAYERSFLHLAEKKSDITVQLTYEAVFGMVANKNAIKREDIVVEVQVKEPKLDLVQLVNVSVDAPSLMVKIGKHEIGLRVSGSSLICKCIEWASKDVVIESYEGESCLLVAREGFVGNNIAIDIAKGDDLKVCAPNINAYYRLIPYNYDFEDTSSIDIVKFMHAMRCILVEFRTHRKDTLAKTAERIEFVTVGNSKIKREVLEYMKSQGIVYSSAHLYKIDEFKLQEKGISFSALSRMDESQLMTAFQDFCRWCDSSVLLE